MNSYTEVQLKVWEIVDSLYKTNNLEGITISIFDEKSTYKHVIYDQIYNVTIDDQKFTTSREFGVWNLFSNLQRDCDGQSEDLSVEQILEKLKALVRDHKINTILKNKDVK